jgi:hypothetical protein
MRETLRPAFLTANTRADENSNLTKKIFLIVSLTVLLSVSCLPTGYAVQGAKIELSISNPRPLRGDVIIVTGRLSTARDNRTIPLVNVTLQYHRTDDSTVVREVTMITSNPSGIFQDIVNTTFLLRIGPWIVNASFLSQLGYPSTWTAETFTVVVQPALSLYISPHSIQLGDNIEFNGLLFACIPCLTDHVVVTLTGPNNKTVKMYLPINATGGPYPGGYYAGYFTPNVAGRWQVRAVWEGNDVTLPAYSQVEQVDVKAQNESTIPLTSLVLLLIGGGLAVVFVVRRKMRQRKV